MKKTNEETFKEYVNHGTDDQMRISGYTSSILKTTLIWIAIVLSLGFLRLVFYWKPEWLLMCTHTQCDLKQATKLLLQDKYSQYLVEHVSTLDSYTKEPIISSADNNSDTDDAQTQHDSCDKVRYFNNKRLKYIWNEEIHNFERLKAPEENASLEYFHYCRGFAKDEQTNKRLLFGENSISIHLTPIYALFFKEVLSPFYIFQIFSCALWFYDDYYYYASCIVLLSSISIAFSLYSIRQNERALRDIIDRSSTVVVFRYDPTQEGKYYEEEIPGEDLVPGDIIAVKNMSIMQCDAVLINGNVIVNESMLTGESVPVTKIAVSNSRTSTTTNQMQVSTAVAAPATENIINIKEHSKHIIFGGTQVIQTRYYENERVKAVVLRTGFSTTKGELIRAILHPKPVDFRFNNDTYKYIGALAFLAFLGMIFSIIMKVLKKNPAEDIIKRSLDIVTIAVPPALPGALTAGLIYAQNRMRKQKIYCISPRTINICGTLDTFVFDKTGTLTEDGLDLKCILPTQCSSDGSLTRSFEPALSSINDFTNQHKDLVEAMASCHSITRIHGELAGDPLDCKMFEFTKWELVEPSNEETKIFNMLVPTIVHPKNTKTKSITAENPYQVGIVRQFPFSSSLQRMSVIVRALDKENFDMYCKGSPEKIAEMTKPESLPKDFQKILTSYTKEGYRVIAVAKKGLDMNYVKVQRVEREKLECDLEFLGLIIMENRLKPQTTPVIRRLNAANIRQIMCTGDNILTALSVARDCEMIQEDERVIVIEANPGEAPKFSYAEIVKKNVTEIQFDPKSKTYKERHEENSHFHFAVNGKSFAVIRDEHKDLLEKLAVRGTVFGRMSPEQKQQLIETLQDLGYFVGMCGDGANDCGALKAANAGISLSNNEASVASPFTSKNPNIECVPTLIKEGRAALVTSFGVVKFIVMYSITQFVSVVILYSINAGLTDFEFLYIDLALMTVLAIFFSRTEAFPDLYKIPPCNKLITWRPICSLAGHMLIIIAIQIFTFYYVKIQPWFEAYEDSPNKNEKNFASYENTALFCVSLFQYITEAVVFSKGAPYRRSIFSNTLFMAALIGTLVTSLLINFVDSTWISEFFDLRIIDDLKFRFIILGIGVVHFFIAFLFEGYIIENDFQMAFEANKEDKQQKSVSLKHHDEETHMKCYPIQNKAQTPYQKIEIEIRRNKQWPPITPQLEQQQSYNNGNLLRASHRKQRTTSTSSAQSNVDSKSKARISSQMLEEYTRV